VSSCAVIALHRGLHRRRREDTDADAVVVTTDDGTQLRCSIAALGRETEPRWVVFDSKANQYVGPVVDTDRSPEAVKRLITEWWATRPRPTGETGGRPPKEART
jgi:hypothetical protein